MDNSRVEGHSEPARWLLSEAERTNDEFLATRLELALRFYEDAMSAHDLEVSSRGIRRAEEMLQLAREQLFRNKLMSAEQQREAETHCASLCADFKRAQTLLRMRVARHPPMNS